MEENKIMNTTETGGKPAVWESASFFLKLVLIFAAFYVFCLYRNLMGITYPLFTAGLLGVYLYFLKKEHQPLKKISVFYMTAIFLLGLSKRREYRKHADDRHGVESHYKYLKKNSRNFTGNLD